MTPTCGMTAHAQKSPNTAERLRAFMEAHGLGVKELAELLSTSPETLEEWFQNDMSPPACLLALALALGTPARVAKRTVALPVPLQRGLSGQDRTATQRAREEEKALRMVRAI